MTIAAPPQDLRKWAEELTDELLKHPFLANYARQQERTNRNGGHFRCVEPWHAIGDKLAQTTLCLTGIFAFGQPGAPTFGKLDKTDKDVAPAELALRLLSSTPYLWTESMRDLALAAPLPPHVVSPDVLPLGNMFWSYETAHSGYGAETNFLAVSGTETGIQIVLDIIEEDGSGRISFGSGEFQYGSRWPDDFPGDQRGAVEVVLKLCAFLNSSVTESTPQRLDRPRRRELKRVDKPDDELVAVVRLRQRKAKSSEEPEPTDVDWKHQWWVAGHYRAQWYPSLNAHRVIWIAPHLKGPEDAPLIERVYSVER